MRRPMLYVARGCLKTAVIGATDASDAAPGAPFVTSLGRGGASDHLCVHLLHVAEMPVPSTLAALQKDQRISARIQSRSEELEGPTAGNREAVVHPIDVGSDRIAI